MGEIYIGSGKNWGEYSLVEHLKNVCSNNEKYKNLYAVWTLDREAHSRALAAIYYNFPHYSMHDESHSLSIINKIEMLLGEERIRSLSPTDTFLILESAYLHDIGMVIAHEELLKEWKESSFKTFLNDLKENSYDKDVIQAATYLLKMQENQYESKGYDWAIKVRDYVTIINSEYYRSRHSTRSASFINEGANIGLHSNYNKLIPKRLIVLLQKIAVSHGVNFEDAFNELEHIDNGIGTDTIHPRFISCLLRLGDLLDLDDGRFNTTFERVALFPDSSKVHKDKHRSITLFLVSPEKIQVSAVCKDTDVYRETRAWFDWLKEEVKNLSSRWSEIVPRGFKGGPPSLGNIKLSIEGSGNINEQLDLQFNINQKRAFELIEGQGIYSDKLIFIRELIQNAMDATKIQMWKDIKNGKYDGMSEALLGISENRLEDIKQKKDFEFPSDLPERIKAYYPIHINIDYDVKKEELSFSIEDRGCGISIYDLKRMENVGGSWNQDRELMKFINDMPEFLRPTGNFGIGLHSVFLATDQMDINTKSEDDKGYDLTFVSRRKNGYITVKENKNKNVVGSKITVKIEGREKIIDCMISSKISDEEIYDLDVFDKELKQREEKRPLLKLEQYTKEIIKYIEIFDIYLNKDINNRNNTQHNSESLNKLNEEIYRIDNYATVRRINNSLLDIEIRDKKEGIILNISRSYNDYGKSSIKFKDIVCTDIYTRTYKFLKIDIHIYKGEAKKILDASRENLDRIKMVNIRSRIDELITNVVNIFSYKIRDIKSINEINFLKENEIQTFLVLYNSLTGKDLIFSNDKVAKSIMMGHPKILDNTKLVDSKGISYHDLINLQKIICYSNVDNIEELEKAISNFKDRGNDHIFYISRHIDPVSVYVKNNFTVNTILKTFYIDEIFDYRTIVSACRKNESPQIEFVNEEDRSDYIMSFFTNQNRFKISPISSINDIYRILMVQEYLGVSSNLLPSRLLYPNRYKIISPFYNIKKDDFIEKDIDYIIDFLKRERYFNELVDWVSKYSIEKDNYKDKDIKEEIENAYKVFIKECFDTARKVKMKNKIKENDIDRDRDNDDLDIDKGESIQSDEVAATSSSSEQD